MDFIGEVDSINLNEIGSNNLMMDISKLLNDPTSVASGSGSGLQSNQVTQVELNLRLVVNQGKYYVVDHNDKSGYNLINQLEMPLGQEKPNLVNVTTTSGLRFGISTGVDSKLIQTSSVAVDGDRLNPNLSEFPQAKKCSGLYLNLNFPNAHLKSADYVTFKSDTNSVFVV